MPELKIRPDAIYKSHPRNIYRLHIDFYNFDTGNWEHRTLNGNKKEIEDTITTILQIIRNKLDKHEFKEFKAKIDWPYWGGWRGSPNELKEFYVHYYDDKGTEYVVDIDGKYINRVGDNIC